MRPDNDSTVIPVLVSLCVGAAAGALLVALNTNKPSHEHERQAKLLARGSNRGRAAVAEDSDGLLGDWKVSPASPPEPEVL